MILSELCLNPHIWRVHVVRSQEDCIKKRHIHKTGKVIPHKILLVILFSLKIWKFFYRKTLAIRQWSIFPSLYPSSCRILSPSAVWAPFSLMQSVVFQISYQLDAPKFPLLPRSCKLGNNVQGNNFPTCRATLWCELIGPAASLVPSPGLSVSDSSFRSPTWWKQI